MANEFKLVLFAVMAASVSACAHRATPVAVSGPPDQDAAASASQGLGTQTDFANAAGDRVFFETDHYNLSGEAREILQRQAAWLKRYPDIRVLVSGNCDERGTREYNLALGARRAAAAREWLIASGIDAARIQTTSYGKDRPIDTRANEEGWASNRNAQTQLLNPAVS